MRQNAHQAEMILRVSLALLIIVAGVDKYFHLLTNWEQYISPLLMNWLGPRGTSVFMKIDGVFEILMGIGVALKPKWFADVAVAWFVGIILNLLTTQHFYDIILRDAGLAASALALGRLSRRKD